MRKIIVSTMVTLDGVEDAPQNWSFDYWNDEIGKYAYDQLFSSDALLLGRETYIGFAEAWPGRSDEHGFADRINQMPKYVVSSKLDKVEWHNSHLLKGDLVAEITHLKQQDGQNILKYGGGKLLGLLIEHGLLDELRLLVYPVVLNKGTRVLDATGNTTLKLLASQTFNTGVVALHYQPVQK